MTRWLTMRRFVFGKLALVALASLGVLAFVGNLNCGSVPRRHYFALTYPMEPAVDAATRPYLHPFRLRLRPFKIALPYNRPQIVYRQSPYEFGYYAFRMWAAKPQHMLRELVERHISAARLVQDVSREYGEKLPDYELSAEILAIEEYDSGDVWYGHLAMRFELVRFADKMPLWSYFFDRKRKVWEKQPVYVVRALSLLAEEEMRRVTAELDAVFSRERGVAPTLVVPEATLDDDATEAPGELSPPVVRVGPTGHPPAFVPLDDELIVPDEAIPRPRGRKEGGEAPDPIPEETRGETR